MKIFPPWPLKDWLNYWEPGEQIFDLHLHTMVTKLNVKSCQLYICISILWGPLPSRPLNPTEQVSPQHCDRGDSGVSTGITLKLSQRAKILNGKVMHEAKIKDSDTNKRQNGKQHNNLNWSHQEITICSLWIYFSKHVLLKTDKLYPSTLHVFPIHQDQAFLWASVLKLKTSKQIKQGTWVY